MIAVFRLKILLTIVDSFEKGDRSAGKDLRSICHACAPPAKKIYTSSTPFTDVPLLF
jgi:hypothetical protein